MSEQKGLYDKYMVVKVVDGTVIENCFILRPDKDPAAVKALQAYAAATENKVLAADLFAWVGRPMQKPLMIKEVKRTGCVYLEDCDKKEVIPALIEFVTKDYIGFRNRCGVLITASFEDYGTRWRCWAYKPTDEERAAAPWKE